MILPALYFNWSLNSCCSYIYLSFASFILLVHEKAFWAARQTLFVEIMAKLLEVIVFLKARAIIDRMANQRRFAKEITLYL